MTSITARRGPIKMYAVGVKLNFFYSDISPTSLLIFTGVNSAIFGLIFRHHTPLSRRGFEMEQYNTSSSAFADKSHCTDCQFWPKYKWYVSLIGQ